MITVVNKNIISENIYLRSLKSHDITEDFVSSLNDYKTEKYVTDLITVKNLKKWVLNTVSPKHFMFGVFDKNTDELLGFYKVKISKKEIGIPSKEYASFLTIIKPKYRGQGATREGALALRAFVFDVLKLDSVVAEIAPDHPGAIDFTTFKWEKAPGRKHSNGMNTVYYYFTKDAWEAAKSEEGEDFYKRRAIYKKS